MHPAAAPRGGAHAPVDTDKIVGGSKLFGEMRNLIRRKHYSIRTEQAYLAWAKRYVLFHGKGHPSEMGEAQIAAFLDHLAVNRNVAASTQNQALNALVFLYKQVLRREDLALDNITPGKRPQRLPTVFDRGDIERLFAQLDGAPKLAAALLYGAGLRLLEGLRLRIQDIEFERNQIIVRNRGILWPSLRRPRYDLDRRGLRASQQNMGTDWSVCATNTTKRPAADTRR